MPCGCQTVRPLKGSPASGYRGGCLSNLWSVTARVPETASCEQATSCVRHGVRRLRTVNPGASPRRRATAFAALAVMLPLLAGCSLLEGPTPDTPPRETAAVPEVAPEFVPGGTAEENLPYFTEVLRTYSTGTSPIQGAPVVQAVTEAGFDPALMQVSFDQTKTSLPADNIFVSVRAGAECLIGQLVTEDRSFVASVEPALGPDKTICLIGKTAPIAGQ